MRYISIPAPIALKNKFTGEDGDTVKFKDFVLAVLLSDTTWIKSYAAIKAAKAIDEALETESGTMVLDSADWEKLKAVAENPSAGYTGFGALGMIQIISFVDAIMNAPDKPPLAEVPA